MGVSRQEERGSKALNPSRPSDSVGLPASPVDERQRSLKLREERDRKSKSEKPPPKIVPLPGAIESRMIRCGKPTCRCARADLHGPYFVRRWREKGRRRSQYVRKKDVLRVKVAVQTFRWQQNRDRQELREALRMLRSYCGF